MGPKSSTAAVLVVGYGEKIVGEGGWLKLSILRYGLRGAEGLETVTAVDARRSFDRLFACRPTANASNLEPLGADEGNGKGKCDLLGLCPAWPEP